MEGRRRSRGYKGNEEVLIASKGEVEEEIMTMNTNIHTMSYKEIKYVQIHSRTCPK